MTQSKVMKLFVKPKRNFHTDSAAWNNMLIKVQMWSKFNTRN